MTEVSREELLEEGRKQARIHGVDQACAQVYAEGWAAAIARATRAIEEAQRAADRWLWDANFNADLAAKSRIAELERQLRCVQIYGYGYLLRHGGEQIELDPQDVTVVLPASRRMDDFDLHNSLHLAEQKLAVLERRIARVRQMCESMVRLKDAQAIIDVLDGADDGPRAAAAALAVEPGERCDHLYAYFTAFQGVVIVQCGLRRHGSYGPHVGSYRGETVTWTMADHREDKAE